MINFKNMKLRRMLPAIIMIATLLTLSGFESQAKKKKDEKAKYIFLFIGDGMGMGQVNLTDCYLSYKNGKLGGQYLTFSQFP